MRVLFSSLSSLRRKVLMRLPRAKEPTADSAERRERWNQVIAQHQKPRADDHQSTSPTSSGAP